MLKPMLGMVPRRGLLPVIVFVLVIFCSWHDGACQVTPESQVRKLNANEVFAELSRTMPEFGGMFIDEENHDTLDIYVLREAADTATRLDAAINALPELASARAGQSRIKLLPGQYSFVQLKEWHDRMSPVVLAIPGAVLTAIDQRWNRLLIGLGNPAIEFEVLAKLDELGIPREAVELEESPLGAMPSNEEAPPAAPFEPAAKTLQSEVRPLVGGIEISHEVSKDAYTVCTLGFIADRDKVRGFVTNSHCTKIQGGVENTVFYQPEPENANKIGTETVDPCYSGGPEPSFPLGCKPIPPPIPAEDKCPEKMPCRYSDSAFAALEKDVPAMMGYIARPLRTGTITWDPQDTFFQIVGEQNIMMINTPVSWVGQISGWREGPLSVVCMNYTVDGYTQLCQNLLNSGPGNEGDSGSPVFVCLDNSSPPKIVDCPGPGTDKIRKVSLVGIKWGSVSVGAVRRTSYSPIGSMSDGKVKGVENSAHELGPLKKCAEGGC